MGDINIDIGISHSYHGKLEQFCIFLSLKSLIKKKTSMTKTHKSKINLILKNKTLA